MVDLVVEDGTGVVTANAYLTVAEADDLLSFHVHSAWNDLDPVADAERKANLLIWATQIIDSKVRWHGKKTYETSGIGWPRTGVRDREGLLIDDNIVHPLVKQATAVLASYLIAGNPDEVDESSRITMMQADVVAFKFDPYAPKAKFPDTIGELLRGLGWVSMGRGGPKFIIKH